MGAEKQFENRIKNFLKEQSCWFLKTWGGGQFTKSGVPDILACINGHFVAIEVKAQNGKPSELQMWNIKQIRNARGYAMVLYPSAWEEFKAFILQLKKGEFEYSPDAAKEVWE